ncbi:MAG: XkdX family protein [Clostridia bacterium]|nr:XkdX family protein [Clostridia bacterium]
MSKHFERIKRYYQRGLYSDEHILALRDSGVITLEEAESLLKEKTQD